VLSRVPAFCCLEDLMRPCCLMRCKTTGRLVLGEEIIGGEIIWSWLVVSALQVSASYSPPHTCIASVINDKRVKNQDRLPS